MSSAAPQPVIPSASVTSKSVTGDRYRSWRFQVDQYVLGCGIRAQISMYHVYTGKACMYGKGMHARRGINSRRILFVSCALEVPVTWSCPSHNQVKAGVLWPRGASEEERCCSSTPQWHTHKALQERPSQDQRHFLKRESYSANVMFATMHVFRFEFYYEIFRCQRLEWGCT